LGRLFGTLVRGWRGAPTGVVEVELGRTSLAHRFSADLDQAQTWVMVAQSAMLVPEDRLRAYRQRRGVEREIL
jgi:hypothetical protein